MAELYTKVYGEEVLNYKIHLEILGYSPSTIKEKHLYLKAFFRYLEENKIFTLEEIQPKDVAEYYKTLQQKKERKHRRSNHQRKRKGKNADYSKIFQLFN